jgi:hypothetical protein
MKPFRPLTAALTVFLSAAPVFAQDPKKEAEPAALVYEGQPLKLPLECRYADLLRAGLVCNEDVPCDLSLELVAVRGSKTSVFVIGDIYSPAATVSSILLGSHDGGTTWTEAAARVPAASLDLMQFADDKNGWVGGQERDIDDSVLPFFFITRDGGRFWDRRNVWDVSADRSGAIVEFYFESARHVHPETTKPRTITPKRRSRLKGSPPTAKPFCERVGSSFRCMANSVIVALRSAKGAPTLVQICWL